MVVLVVAAVTEDIGGGGGGADEVVRRRTERNVWLTAAQQNSVAQKGVCLLVLGKVECRSLARASDCVDS